MKDKKIQSILQDALEEEIPSSQIHLWPAVKASLVAGNPKLDQQGVKMNTIKSRRIPRLAYAALVIVPVLVFIFATPQGRAFAQSILQFFNTADSESIPLDDSQKVDIEEHDPTEPTVEPPMLFSIAEAEALVGFDAAELPFVPEGLEFLGARVYGTTITIEYQVPGYGGSLILAQSQEGYNQSDWDKVPASAIIPVKIGEADGEFVQGMFVVYAGETSATWNPDASILRLRWFANGIWFEITKHSDNTAVDYLDMEGLIELAESLVFSP